MWNLGSWECKRKQRGIQVRIKYEKFMILQEWLYARKQQVGISAHSYFLFFPLPRESVPTCRSMSSSWHPPECKVHACEKTPPLLGEKGIDVFVSLLESTYTHTFTEGMQKKDTRFWDLLLVLNQILGELLLLPGFPGDREENARWWNVKWSSARSCGNIVQLINKQKGLGCWRRRRQWLVNEDGFVAAGGGSVAKITFHFYS